MSTQILYNNTDIFAGRSTVPFVSIDYSYLRNGTDFWGRAISLSLAGILTGQSNIDLLFKQRQLISGFSQQFRPISIFDGGVPVFSGHSTKVNSIDFESSDYVKLLPYTINLSSYDSGKFSYYGIVEPSENWTFQEQDDGIIDISHSISARGFNTNGVNALNNAKSFCESLTGTLMMPQGLFLHPSGLSQKNLMTLAESVDRFNGTYSIEESYLIDPANPSSEGYIRYSLDGGKNAQEGITSVSLKGEAVGYNGSNFSSLQSMVSGFNAYNPSNFFYQSLFNPSGSLNISYLQKDVSENTSQGSISFSSTFDDFLGQNTFVDLDASTNRNTKNLISEFELKGRVFGRGPLATRWPKVKATYESLNLDGLARSEYAAISDGQPVLNKFWTKRSVTYNEFDGIIDFSLSYNNKNIPIPNAKDVKASVSVSPPIRQFSPNPVYRGQGNWFVFDLGFKNRGSTSVSVTVVGSPSIGAAKSYAVLLFNQSVQGVSNVELKEETIEYGKFDAGDTKTISMTWTYDAEAFTT